MEGWLKLHRSLAFHNLWTSEPFTRGQAWVDLLMLANHAPGIIRKQGLRIDLERGDVGWSEIELSTRWKWSRGKVRRFLDELKTDHMITRKTVQDTDEKQDKRKFVITIVNYNKYQIPGSSNDTSDDTGDRTGDGQATVQATVQEQEGEEEKKKKKTYTQDFEKFWSAYPCRQGRKQGKKEAFAEWRKVVRDVDAGFLVAQIEMLAPQYGEYPVDACRWLKHRRWEDEISTESHGHDQFAGVL